MAEMDYDDIDLLTPTDPAQFYASSAPVVNVLPTSLSNTELQSIRRSGRACRSLNAEITKAKPRKRTLSTSALQNSASTNPTKKIKLDKKKAVRALL